jgi:hypothetical protein
MVKKEFYLIGFGLGAFIPLLFFVLFWWSIVALKIFKILSFPESLVTIFALSGFLFGVIMDIFYLKRLIPQFYKFKMSLMMILYLFCSAIAVAFFMGFPVGNLLLGAVAGLYIGRKYHYLDRSQDELPFVVKTTCMFTALVTSLEALPIGLFVLQDTYLLGSINHFLGFQIFSKNMVIDITIIAFLCLMLYVVQNLLTKRALKIAYNI